LGGEKLKSSWPYPGFPFAALIIIAGLFAITFPLNAQARDPASPGVDESAIVLGEPPAAPVVGVASSGWVVFRMVLVLAVAALAIYGVVFFIKRLARPQENRDPNLKVLARVSLGSDSYAAVVSLGAKAWLVGGGSGGVSLISEISDTDSLETLLIEDARRTAGTGAGGFIDFRSLISRLAGSSRGKPPESPGASHAENLRRQRERLKGL
jgi:flagellar protein FliO/FliZ